MNKSKGKHRDLTLKRVYKMQNLINAEKDARRGKSRNYGVRKFDRNPEENLKRIQASLIDGTFKTMEPKFESRVCDNGKVRVLSKVNYEYHIVHHAVMRIIMPVLDKSYYYESAASITGRGIHYAAKHVRKFIDRNSNKDLWWAQIDFVKCYHNVSREKLYEKICKTFMDPGIRWLLHDIIYALGDHNGLGPSDGTRGVGIGLYPVQPLVNFYLNDLDRKASKVKDTRVFRYCDNILIIGFSPKAVWECINVITKYVKEELDQPLHTNIGVQKLDHTHPVDFVGYRFYKDLTGVRTSLKKNFKKKTKHWRRLGMNDKLYPVLVSYKGWLQFSDSFKLWRKVTGMKSFSDLDKEYGLTSDYSLDADGKRIFQASTLKLANVKNEEITILDFEPDVTTKEGDGRCFMLIEMGGKKYKICTSNKKMIDILNKLREEDTNPDDPNFPFKTVIKSECLDNGRTTYMFS